MADPRENYASLEHPTTKEGVALSWAQQGDPQASRNANAVIPATDAAGNLQYPLVDAQRRLMVATNVGDTAELWESGEHTAGSATFVDVTGALITLQNDMEYKNHRVVVSCRVAAHFRLVWKDDTTDTILAEFILEPGHSTHSATLDLPFVSGSTGTQTLRLEAKNFNALPLSALRGTVGTTEIQ